MGLTEATLVAQAVQLANRAVISDIESECCSVELAGVRWFDTRPMLDPREHDPSVIDMAREALDYARESNIVAVHPELPHLVRVVHRG